MADSYPSFIYDQFRPGIENDAQGKVWREYREKLEGIMHAVVLQAGASIEKQFGDIEDERTKGDSTIMRLYRTEPPITAEEACLLGSAVVTAWEAVASTEEIPEFCDTVFPLQDQPNSNPSS